ncbi:MAG: sigma-B regulation protein RsbU (phosphoserine phosphatase), partial [Algoriphagus sp.]
PADFKYLGADERHGALPPYERAGRNRSADQTVFAISHPIRIALKQIFDADHLLQSLPCACLAFDDKGKIEFVNAFLCEALGYSAEELTGQRFEQILTISSRMFYQTHFFPLLRLNGKVSEIFLMLRSKTSQSIPVIVNGSREIIGEQMLNVCACFTVWERQKYENELLESNKVLQKALEENAMLDSLKNDLESHQQKLDQQISVLIQRSNEYVQLNKVLSHDLQEPIRKIGIFADILFNTEKVSADSQLSAYTQRIRETVERLRDLTSCLQQFVNVESQDEKFMPIELGALIKEATYAAKEATGYADFAIEIAELPWVEGRGTQFVMLFTELIKNAIENRKDITRLHIEVRATIVEENSYHASKNKYRYTDHLRLEITDNGMGFEKKYSTYVFGLFNKLNAESKGMGMGLALCKQIVSNHYGAISIQTEEGVGCTVIVTLPLHQPETH